MSVYSAEYHAMVHSPASTTSPASNVEQVTVAAPKSDGGGFFHHLLDVINPLQHLPVIGNFIDQHFPRFLPLSPHPLPHPAILSTLNIQAGAEGA